VAAGGLIVAAPASGSGKTLVTAGLLRCLWRRGVPAAAAKAGPDFIDPTFHALAAGAPCRNLDVWGMRAATLAATVAELEAAAEIVLCEGVMGLFDGTGADGETGSTAELARVTGWPIVLVLDVRRQGASVAALLRGFAGHRPGTAPAAVIFNRVAGERHKAVLETAVTRWLPDLVVLGALPDDPALALSARHLGLVPAAENRADAAVIDRAADAIGAAFPLRDRHMRGRGGAVVVGGRRRRGRSRSERFAPRPGVRFDFPPDRPRRRAVTDPPMIEPHWRQELSPPGCFAS
jgi:cobyrinic acid a,c-diamide synthase